MIITIIQNTQNKIILRLYLKRNVINKQIQINLQKEENLNEFAKVVFKK